MDQRVGIGFLVGTGLAIAMGLGRGEPGVQVVGPIDAPATRALVSGGAARADAVPDAIAAVSPQDVSGAPPDLVRTLELVGGYGGEGVIRCPVGDRIPDGPVVGLSRGHVRDGFLVGTVASAHGDARVHLATDAVGDEPRTIVRWQEAWPGTTTECDVVPPELVTVDGWVIRPDGTLVTQGEIGNAVDGTWPIRPDGSFAVECWLGARCPLAVRMAMGMPWSRFESIDPDGPMYGIELVYEGPEAPPDLLNYLQAQVDLNDALAAMPDPLTLALEDPSLPPTERTLVEAWRAEEARNRASAAGLLDELLHR